MKKKALLIVMSSVVTAATAATVIFSTKFSGEPVEAGSHKITLDASCAKNCHYNEDEYRFDFELTGTTASGLFPFSSDSSYTYFYDYVNFDGASYTFGGDHILVFGNYNYACGVYIAFDFEGPGICTAAYAVIKENSEKEYKHHNLSFEGGQYVYNRHIPDEGVVYILQFVFEYTC